MNREKKKQQMAKGYKAQPPKGVLSLYLNFFVQLRLI
jgi:hypothetical protein